MFATRLDESTQDEAEQAEARPIEDVLREKRRREVRDALLRENVAGRLSDRALIEALNTLEPTRPA